MDHFHFRAGALFCEDVPAAELAQRLGTPLYVYSRSTLLEHLARFQQAFAELAPLVCFAVKSCSNIHILRELAAAGSGFDIVSGGELHRALVAGADPRKIVFAGVGKSRPEIEQALATEIGLFNAESEAELELLAECAAAAGRTARVALRVNPDVDPHTHAYTTTGTRETKFGVDVSAAPDLFRRFASRRGLDMCGIHLHIGSQVNDARATADGVRRGVEMVEQLRRDGFAIDTFDAGGGFGAHYRGDEAPSAAAYSEVLTPLLRGRGLRIIFEPGRSIAANAGILLARVLRVKTGAARKFVILDAAMTDLIRPALYGAYHFIWPAHCPEFVPANRAADQPFGGLEVVDVVGPVCESGDFLAHQRALPPLQAGDLVAVYTCGAYGMTMASQYNSRPRAPEVLVHGAGARLVRRRETMDDLLRAERELG